MRNMTIDTSTYVADLAEQMALEARDSVKQADGEARSGSAAHETAIQVLGENDGRDLGNIALAHYERAAMKYREAIGWFEQAVRIWPEAKHSVDVREEIEEVTGRAAKVDAAVLFLNNFLGQH